MISVLAMGLENKILHFGVNQIEKMRNGYVCETDTFAENISLNKTFEGDILCFKNAGAYCFSMSSNYNSRLKPAEVLISKREIRLIRKIIIDSGLNNDFKK